MSTADRVADAAALHRPAEVAVPPHLLGHGEDLEPKTLRLRGDRPGIRFGRVEVDHIGVRRDAPRLMEGDRLLDEARVAAAEYVEEHLGRPFDQRRFSRSVKRDRGKDDEAADHHLLGNAEAHEDEAVVEHAHEQRADERAEDRADAAIQSACRRR